jgi:hypothetical protein
MIEELIYFKIIYQGEIAGGMIASITGMSFCRIDRISLAPEHQGKKIGSRVIELLEEEFPAVRTWDLETSSRQVNNHHFYEKMGYRITFKTEDEYCYIKRKESPAAIERLTENQDLGNAQYENCNMSQTEFYQVNAEGSSFSNSNLMKTHISNCNLSHSKFQNINFRHSFFADLNLSYSKMRLVTLAGVRFMDINLGDDKEPISFERCDLQGTTIKNSSLRNMQVADCDITGMTIDGIPVEKLLEVYYQEIKK